MFDKLNEFFGQDSNREQDYRDFEKRYRENPDSISNEEAARRYREMMAHQDDSDINDANDPEAEAEYERAFSKMSPEERRALAQHYQNANNDSSRSFQGFPQGKDLEQAAKPRELSRMTRQASKQDPDLLTSLLGPNSPLNSTGGKMAMAGLAAFAAKRFLGKR